MVMKHFNDTHVKKPSDSSGKKAFHSRSQSRFHSQQSFPAHSKFDFKKPRFSERNSYPKIPLSVNRSKLSIPYKSELCLLFQKGKCYFGENCHFAHSMSEVGKPGFKTVAMEDRLNEDSKRDAMCRVKECHYVSSGMDCPYGYKCQFLHKSDQNVRKDVGLYGERGAIYAVNGRNDSSGCDQIECRSLNAFRDYDKSVFYKTKLCMKWKMFGSCPYGVKCIYAHGKAELQELGSSAQLDYSHASRLILDSQPNNAASCEEGIRTAQELQMQGKRCFMKWNIEKIGEIYADWMGDRNNFHDSLSEVGS